MTGLRDKTSLGSSIADELPVGVWVASVPGGELLYANRRFAEIMGTGARPDVAAGGYAQPYGIHDRSGGLYPEARMPFVLAMERNEPVTADDIVIHRHDGRKVYIHAEARPVADAQGRPSYVVIAFSDITREVEAEIAKQATEARLAHAQRMEALGQLAGGVAHDFNNLLASIKVLASSLRLDERDERRRECLLRIDEVTDSAAALARSLLGFARRGKHLDQVVSLNEVMGGVADLVGRTLDRRIEVRADASAASGAVRGDYVQLEQVVMNLAINARDAMPAGGTLTLRTSDLVLPGSTLLPPRLHPGPHVVLDVTDTGPGIPEAVRGHIFEPYFTTRTEGEARGSGLGLATVYGIVESHQGWVEVGATGPDGTTMRVYLPAAGAPPIERARPAAVVNSARTCGIVLVVDDDPHVREATAVGLRTLGHTVMVAASGAQAIALYEAHQAEISIVLLDMIMPHLDGRNTFLALRAIDPHVVVMLTTGYALNDEAQHIIDLGVQGFVPKPFDLTALSIELGRLARQR